MRNQFICVAFLCYALAVPGQMTNAVPSADKSVSTRQQSGSDIPSLADTEKWIRNTFDSVNTGDINCSEFDSSRMLSDGYGPEQYCLQQRYTLEFDGCKVTLLTFHSHTGMRIDRNTNRWITESADDKTEDSRYRFDLSDIDPKSILAEKWYGTYGSLKKRTFHDNQPQVSICLATTDSANTILLDSATFFPDGQPIKLHELCGVLNHFVTVQPDYAPRFVKALTHAVELCGGKPSAF